MKQIQIDKIITALNIAKAYNRLRNDEDAYCYAIIDWALENKENKPNPEDYGLMEL